MLSYLLILALFAVSGQCFMPFTSVFTKLGSDYEKCERAKPVKKHNFLDLAGGKYYVRAMSRDYDPAYEQLKSLDSVIFYFQNTNESNIYNLTVKWITKSMEISSNSVLTEVSASSAKLVTYKHNRFALLYNCAPPPYRSPWGTVDRDLLSTKVNTNIKQALFVDANQQMEKQLIRLPFKNVEMIDN